MHTHTNKCQQRQQEQQHNYHLAVPLASLLDECTDTAIYLPQVDAFCSNEIYSLQLLELAYTMQENIVGIERQAAEDMNSKIHDIIVLSFNLTVRNVYRWIHRKVHWVCYTLYPWIQFTLLSFQTKNEMKRNVSFSFGIFVFLLSLSLFRNRIHINRFANGMVLYIFVCGFLCVCIYFVAMITISSIKFGSPIHRSTKYRCTQSNYLNETLFKFHCYFANKQPTISSIENWNCFTI